MIPTLGNASLYIALLLSLSIVFYKVWKWMGGADVKHEVLLVLWGAELGAIFIAFISLIYCFAVSDFSVINVLNNSHTSKPLLYKIVAAWGNHEGSMLLWVLCMAFFSILFGFMADRSMKFVSSTLIVQAALMFCFLSFIIFVSNPFLRVFPVPLNGLGFNPILQDIGLAMHPPMLYLGYVGFSITYSAAVAGLWHGEVNRRWAENVRTWVLFSWSCLTMGITLGSWWAYRELGWGGFWFWDPVENASLMPWLIACALIHSLLVLQRRGLHANWCYILAILTFSMSVIGTFIVRSGLVTSVHAFANDPTRGMFILTFIAVMLGGALLLHLIKKMPEEHGEFCLSGREGFIYWNNLLLATAAFIVVLGTLYPKVIEVVQDKLISVGAPYFNQLFAPLSVMLGLLCMIGTRAIWGASFSKFRFYGLGFSMLTAVIAGIVALVYGGHDVICSLVILSGVGLMVSQFTILRRELVSSLAHIGIAVLMISVAFNAMLQKNVEKAMNVGDIIQMGSYTLQLHDITLHRGKNYLARRAMIEVKSGDKLVAVMEPETRFFPVENQQTTEAAIQSEFLYDIYIAVGQVYDDGSIVVRGYLRPMIMGIWLAGFMIASAGMISAIALLKKRWVNYRRNR